MHSLLRATAAVALTAACLGAHAHGSTTCDVIPENEWQPQTALQKKLTAEGWKVRQVKTWHGCYEVYGFDDKGARTEAFFNPKTFERVDRDEPAEKK